MVLKFSKRVWIDMVALIGCFTSEKLSNFQFSFE